MFIIEGKPLKDHCDTTQMADDYKSLLAKKQEDLC